MSESDRLVSVFMPPLATWLAQAEQKKGAPLSETEVLRIRDKAPCITMEPEDAAAMAASRGFRDVVPENCWADWHRLRVEMTGKGYLPRVVMCVLGSEGFPAAARPLLESAGVEHEVRGRDDRMATAFEASQPGVDRSLEAADWEGIQAHAHAVYFLSEPMPAADGPRVSLSCLQLGRRLLEAGGVAMKCESSGLAHSRSRWLDLAATAAAPEADWGSWAALARAFVQPLLDNGTDWHTCGMHLLGRPDLILSQRLAAEAAISASGAAELFDTFGVYLLAECAVGYFAPGHTFRTDNHAPRFRVAWEPCTGYDEDDFFFNPFGRWRFAEVVR